MPSHEFFVDTDIVQTKSLNGSAVASHLVQFFGHELGGGKYAVNSPEESGRLPSGSGFMQKGLNVQLSPLTSTLTAPVGYTSFTFPS